MSTVNQVFTQNLSAQFDLGNIEPNKVRVKIGGSLSTLADGTISNIPVTTSITPKSWAGATINDAIADVDANVANALELSDGSYITSGRVDWAAHGLVVGSYYYLSQSTAGDVTDTQPVSGLVQRLFFVPATDYVLVEIQEAYTL